MDKEMIFSKIWLWAIKNKYTLAICDAEELAEELDHFVDVNKMVEPKSCGTCLEGSSVYGKATQACHTCQFSSNWQPKTSQRIEPLNTNHNWMKHFLGYEVVYKINEIITKLNGEGTK